LRALGPAPQLSGDQVDHSTARRSRRALRHRTRSARSIRRSRQRRSDRCVSIRCRPPPARASRRPPECEPPSPAGSSSANGTPTAPPPGRQPHQTPENLARQPTDDGQSTDDEKLLRQPTEHRRQSPAAHLGVIARRASGHGGASAAHSGCRASAASYPRRSSATLSNARAARSGKPNLA